MVKKYIVLHPTNLQDILHRIYVTLSIVKDLFESVANHSIIDFIKYFRSTVDLYSVVILLLVHSYR